VRSSVKILTGMPSPGADDDRSSSAGLLIT